MLINPSVILRYCYESVLLYLPSVMLFMAGNQKMEEERVYRPAWIVKYLGRYRSNIASVIFLLQ